MEPFKQPNLNLNASTGIFLDSGSIDFKVNQGTCMTLTNGGNLGIGTTPENILHIKKDPTKTTSDSNYQSENGFGQFHIETDRRYENSVGTFLNTSKLKIGVQQESGQAIDPLAYIQGINDNHFAVKLLLNPVVANVGIGTTAPTSTLYVNGDIFATGTINSSDDRIKYNEENITNTAGLSVIKQLQPQKYEKIIEIPQGASGTWIPTDAEWPNVKDNYVWGLEAGLIAQNIQAIPGLSFAVSGQEVNSEGTQTPLALNYNDVYAYHIAATKELSFQLETEKAKTTNLETQMESANSKIAVLETQVTDLIARVSALESA